jgi:hypothetical protein
MVDPGCAQVDWRPAEIDGVQSSADPGTGLEDHALDAAVHQRVRDRQSGDAGADHDDAFDRLEDPARHVRSPVVVPATSQGLIPSRSKITRYACANSRHENSWFIP